MTYENPAFDLKRAWLTMARPSAPGRIRLGWCQWARPEAPPNPPVHWPSYSGLVIWPGWDPAPAWFVHLLNTARP